MSSHFVNHSGACKGFWRPLKPLFSFLSLLGCLGAAGATAQATPLPADAPRISVGDASISEGNSGFRDLLFTTSIPAPVAYDVTVKAQTIDMTAKAGSDYAASTGNRVIIRAGQTSSLLKIRVSTDKIEERDEQFRIRLFDATNATLLDGDALGTILDDDYAGQISINDISFVEQNSGQKVAKSLVRFSQPALHDISVRYETKPGTATSGSDFVDTKGTLLFKPGRVALDISTPILGDTTPEPDETFAVNLLVTGYVPQKGSGAVKIVNDDGPIPINLVVDDKEVSEDTNFIGFYVRLSHAPDQNFDVPFSTQDGTAQAGSDYNATGGTLHFGPNQTEAYVQLFFRDDHVEEPDESFGFKLSPPPGIGGDLESVISIRDDDYAGQISISDVSLNEGNSGKQAASVKVSLSQPPLHPLNFYYAAQSGSAYEGSDFVAISGNAVLNPGSGPASFAIAVPILGDTVVESDETLKINFYAFNAKLLTGNPASGSGIITIVNDDGVVVPPPPGLSGKIAFLSDRAGFDSDVWVMNADGTNPTRLTKIGRSFAPHFSRDGQKIAFSSYRSSGTSGGYDLYTINADGTGETRLTFDSSRSLSYYIPSWSPDGQKIICGVQSGDPYASTPNVTTELYIMGADGSNPTKIAISGVENQPGDFVHASSPVFSPDGQKIAFSVFFGGAQKLYVMNADGSGAALLTNQGHAAVSGVFSPDGQQIAFTSERSNGEQIWKMNADGTHQVMLTQAVDPRDCGGLYSCFAPDGQHIAFTTTRYDASNTSRVQIYVMNADGSAPIAITHGGPNDYDQQPSWAPGSVSAPAASPAAGPNPAPSGGHA